MVIYVLSVAHVWAQNCSIQDKILLAKNGYTKVEIESQCSSSQSANKKQVVQNKETGKSPIFQELASLLSADVETFDNEGSNQFQSRSHFENGYLTVFIQNIRLYRGERNGSPGTVFRVAVKDIDFSGSYFQQQNGGTMLFFKCLSERKCASYKWNNVDAADEYIGVMIALDRRERIEKLISQMSKK